MDLYIYIYIYIHGGRNGEEFREMERSFRRSSLVSLGKIVTKFPSFFLEIRRGNKERPTSRKGINGFLAR